MSPQKFYILRDNILADSLAVDEDMANLASTTSGSAMIKISSSVDFFRWGTDD